ncbi:MAG TPA: hypothetical protein VFR94_22015 [Nitrososphaeraceae archaeon]|nr:hypothetical protein [Nitrososphaeraceae archaeon]
MIAKSIVMHKYIILSLLVLTLSGILVYEGSTNAITDSQLTNLISGHLTTPAFGQSASLNGTLNSNLSDRAQSPSNTLALQDTYLIERNRTGSIPTFPTVMEAFKSQISTSLNDATTTALNEVGGNSTALSSTLQPSRGFLVYIVQIVDSNNQLHSVVVDAGDGRVLASSLLPVVDTTRIESRPLPNVPIGPAGPPAGGGYSMPALPPPLPNSGYPMPALPIHPNPNPGLMQPTQPSPPLQ